jgi:CO/xanthine dehydrogenase FAD-binding subunit
VTRQGNAEIRANSDARRNRGTSLKARLGAKVRWHDIERDPHLPSTHPLLRAADQEARGREPEGEDRAADPGAKPIAGGQSLMPSNATASSSVSGAR